MQLVYADIFICLLSFGFSELHCHKTEDSGKRREFTLEYLLLVRYSTLFSISLQGLVMAGLADLTRPADKLSTSQSAVLTATGA